MIQPNKIKVLTWHVHGTYLYYLSKTNCEIYVPVKADRSEGYGGLPTGNFTWTSNIKEIPASKIKNLDFDVILFQSDKNYLVDQYEILSQKQRKLPKVYLEHDPPRLSPTETKHIVRDPDITTVHVTYFNNLMWISNKKTQVIEHGVEDNGKVYTGELAKGLVAVNNISSRGRRLGYDIFEKVRQEVPLDIVGMASEKVDGLGEIPHKKFTSFISRYRFFFSPIRYTSFGLSICEAMMAGLPIVGLSTTEMPSIVKDGVSGFVGNDIDSLIQKMKVLIENPEYAKALGENARKEAEKRFGIKRFSNDWEKVFQKSVGRSEKEFIEIQRSYIGGAI